MGIQGEEGRLLTRQVDGRGDDRGVDRELRGEKSEILLSASDRNYTTLATLRRSSLSRSK